MRNACPNLARQLTGQGDRNKYGTSMRDPCEGGPVCWLCSSPALSRFQNCFCFCTGPSNPYAFLRRISFLYPGSVTEHNLPHTASLHLKTSLNEFLLYPLNQPTNLSHSPPASKTQIKRQLHRTSSELFDTCLAHFRASSRAGATALRERLSAINAAAAASAAAAAAAATPPPPPGAIDPFTSGSDRTRANLSKAREAKEAAAAAAAVAAVAAAAAVARSKKSKKGGSAAVQELAANVPWYGKYVPMEDNAITLPKLPIVVVEEPAWGDWEEGRRRSSSRNVSSGGGG